MAIPTLLELAESGAHFGHHRSLTYSKARRFVFAVQKNIALINLENTQEALTEAQKAFQEFRQADKTILFVGTRRSIRGLVKEIAESVSAAFITERWFGGFLTNYASMAATIKKMNELETYLNGPEAAKLSKKDRLTEARKLERYHRFLVGVQSLTGMPDLLVLASATEDKIAIAEAVQLGIPIIAITDTDMNPDLVTYPIPANDDAPKAVELILRSLISAPTVEKKATKTAKKEEVAEEVTAELEEAAPAKTKKAAAKIKKNTAKSAKAKTA